MPPEVALYVISCYKMPKVWYQVILLYPKLVDANLFKHHSNNYPIASLYRAAPVDAA